MRINLPQDEEPDLEVAPLIDMVFLLLVYFMVTASLVRSEADLGIRLPGAIASAESVDMPDEQIIEISKEGRVVLNGREFDSAFSQDLPDLTATLTQYRMASDLSQSEAMITVMADEQSRHQRVIDVMNACAAAGIRNVTFAGGDGS